MPRYYFNDQDGACHIDKSGTIMPNLETARVAALKLLATLVTDNPTEFWAGKEWKVIVADETRLTLFELLIVATESPAVMQSKPR